MSKRLYTKADTQRHVDEQKPTDKPPEPYRSAFRRDYGRIVHSAAFRRLQGKTQLFPSRDSDFFRNRLTHSLEVAQVAKSIALRLNSEHEGFRKAPIDLDLVELAALAHDLGHPPFGHNGEEALDECMHNAGGFEGNAQTLRILARLEKRSVLTVEPDKPFQAIPVKEGKDNRAGLNLTYRSLAAVLKYDRQIPLLYEQRADDKGPIKGYYYTEAELVAQIRKRVGCPEGEPLRTIECSIMDVADDIAYSTYDLEDAFKFGVFDPLTMLSASSELAKRVAKEVQMRIMKYYPDVAGEANEFREDDVYATIYSLFFKGLQPNGPLSIDAFVEAISKKTVDAEAVVATITSTMADDFKKTATNGYYRTRLMSAMVGMFIQAIEVNFNEKHPALSRVRLELDMFKIVEVLKNFTYHAIIMSPMLKVAEFRGKEIVQKIFEALSKENSRKEAVGHLLMPQDFRDTFANLGDSVERKRAICDFIAGMTDRYAIQFYSRLYGTTPESIYAPL
jgi:dGTPase